MPRPRKKAADLTTPEVLRKLFPPEVRAEAKNEIREAVRKADEQATKQDSK